jgi:hypothetical protein
VLDLLEVAAYAGPAAYGGALLGANLLLLQRCTASSTTPGSAPVMAVDGSLSQLLPFTTADSNSWLNCSVGGSAQPQTLRIWPYPGTGNVNFGRLLNASVALLHGGVRRRFVAGLDAAIHRELATPGARTFSRAFVTFEKTASAEAALAAFARRADGLCAAAAGGGVDVPAHVRFRGAGAPLTVRQAPEPPEVIWDSLDTGARERAVRKALSSALLFGVCVGLFVGTSSLDAGNVSAVIVVALTAHLAIVAAMLVAFATGRSFEMSHSPPGRVRLWVDGSVVLALDRMILHRHPQRVTRLSAWRSGAI